MGGVRVLTRIRPGAGAGHALPAAHRRTGGIHRWNTGRLAAAGVSDKAQDVLENLGRVTQVFFDKPVRSPSSSRRWCASRCCPARNPSQRRPCADDGRRGGKLLVHILSKGIAKAGAARLRHGSRMASAQSRRPAGSAMAGSIRSSRTSSKTPARAFPARCWPAVFAAAGEDGFRRSARLPPQPAKWPAPVRGSQKMTCALALACCSRMRWRPTCPLTAG